MKVRNLTSLVLAFAISGCSFYDVAAISSDFALALFTDVNEGKAPHDDDRILIWDPETSECIRDEKELRGISGQLDAIEDGKDFVILPTGEKYPIEERSPSNESLQGPTATCLSRTSD
jgi:hypothetical protein